MQKLSKDFIDKIKACGVYGYAKQFTDLKRSGKLYEGRCPHPDHDDTTPSFKIFNAGTTEESWSCMGCHCGVKDGKTNYGSDNIAFAVWMSHHKSSSKTLNFREAALLLAKFYNIPVEYDKFSKLYEANRQLAIACYKKLMSGKYNDVLEYLIKERGLDNYDILKWNIGYNGDRITFPIKDKYSSIIGFSNRMFGDLSIASGKKYDNTANSEVFEKKKVLYGIDKYNDSRNTIMLVEGQMDVIMAHKYGADFTVAPMTCHLSEYHINFLKEKGKSIILCFDSDDAGKKGMEITVNALRAANIGQISILPMPDRMDMADLAMKHKDNLLKYIYENKISYIQYQINRIMNERNSIVTEANERALRCMHSILENVNDKVDKEIISNSVKKILAIC